MNQSRVSCGYSLASGRRSKKFPEVCEVAVQGSIDCSSPADAESVACSGVVCCLLLRACVLLSLGETRSGFLTGGAVLDVFRTGTDCSVGGRTGGCCTEGASPVWGGTDMIVW